MKRQRSVKNEMGRERRARKETEKRVYQLETVLNRMGHGELPPPPGGSTSSTPLRTPRTSVCVTDMVANLSPTVALASKTQKSSKTFTPIMFGFQTIIPTNVQSMTTWIGH